MPGPVPSTVSTPIRIASTIGTQIAPTITGSAQVLILVSPLESV